MKFIPTGKKTTNRTLITIDKTNGGYNNLVDEARLDPKFAKESTNLVQVSDGLWKTRWGTQHYGEALAANPDGASEYVKSDGTTELIAISNGTAYSSTDGGSWSSISGASFTAGVQCYFLQIAGYLYIANGTDSLARYDGTNLITYSGISAPTGLTASLVASGLTSGTYMMFANVTALNDVGETTGSTEASISINKKRDSWTAGTDKVVWYWDSVSNASRYQVYISDESGFEKLLYSTTETSLEDDGSIQVNPYIEVPDDNTTTGPLFKSMALSGNRLWATNNDNDMYKVYFSGVGENMGVFSDFYGGGWINLEKGGREIPVKVVHYQSGQGSGRATILCKTPDGQGAVWQIDVEGVTVGDTSFSVPSAVKIVGSSGTESILGTVSTNKDIGFPNKRGWFFLGPQKNYYGILLTSEASSNIRPYWRSLVSSAVSGIASYFYDAKIFISVPTSSTGNTQTIVYDTERNNWSVYWSWGAKQFLEYTDTGGRSHFLYIPTSGTKLIEISENFLGDLGVGFNQSYISPLLPVSKKETDLLVHEETTVKLSHPRGTVVFEVLGIGKDSSFSTVGTKTIQNLGSNTGVGSDLPSGFLPSTTRTGTYNPTGLAWTTYLLDAPETFTQATTKKTIRKRAQLYNIQYHVYSTSADTDWTLLGIQTKGRLVTRKAPSSWAN